jgi:hypothetical protein
MRFLVTPIVLRCPELGEAVTATVFGYREEKHRIDVCVKPLAALHEALKAVHKKGPKLDKR